MLKIFREFIERRVKRVDEGFTLIELLVVLLIIGILMAIAIPTFLAVTSSANNTAAESNLQTSLTAADAYYTQNNQSYTGANVAVTGLASQDTGVNYVDDTGASPATPYASANSKTVAINVVDANDIVLAALSSGGGGRCYAIADEKTAGGLSSTAVTGSNVPSAAQTYYGYYTVPSAGSCDAQTALTTIAATGAGAWSDTSSGFPS